MALSDIEKVLHDHGFRCSNFNLPVPTLIAQDDFYNNDLEAAEALKLITKLNFLQKSAFDLIVQSIENNDFPQRCFYIDGPGGSGKTFLYNTLMCYIRGRNQIVLPFATTGIAAILLKGGRTIHSGFKLPIPIVDNSVSRMSLHSPDATVIKRSKLIIIDEATMMTKYALRCIDRLLKDIMQIQFPLGGKVILLGGDFRQTLPVIPNSSKAYIIESCLESSDLWVYFKVIHLNENMLLSSEDVEYNSWILNVGESLSNVSNPLLPPDSIEIPNSLLENSLIKSIYGDSIQISDINLFSKKIILTTKNNIALNLNNEIIQKLPGNSKIYFSADSIQTDNPEDLLNFPIEFLHSQTPSGMPPHILNLKVGTIIMLLRNMNPSRGLCNGTRLLIKNLHDNFIDSEILSGTHNGHRVFIPRIFPRAIPGCLSY
ncbi:ATP-dependent DNA helicase pif1-like [Gordionus sp. m RMFG-2023]|uniref:ATP-dependent DNA helicase pif1-like n=1 Tax=Gordionus sp. m RMFG-2023 TaxID=3053472 RepID=UPI0031FCCB23